MNARSRIGQAIARLLSWLPHTRNRHLLFLDIVLLPAAAVLAFVLRLEGPQFSEYRDAIIAYALLAPAIKIPVFTALGLYGRYWQYASTSEQLLVVRNVTVADIAEAAVVFGLIVPLGLVANVPRSIPFLDWLLTLLVVAAPRLSLRLVAHHWQRRKKGRANGEVKRVLIMGAGEAGAMVLRELESNPQLGLWPVGLLDDDPTKIRLHIHRYRILGTRHDIPRLVREYRVDQIIIAIPSAPGRVIRDILDICGQAGVQTKIVPGLYELLDGRLDIRQVRDVRLEDLLRREPVIIDTKQVTSLLRGKRVLVTGAGGSIGSEICRQVMRCSPAELVILGHGENSIFHIARELTPSFSPPSSLHPPSSPFHSPPIHPVIADVRDRARMEQVFRTFRPEIIFHAAAHKHVPLMEANPVEAVTNNVLGTWVVLSLAEQYDVERFVLISTDKAVNPSSVMGATKRVAESLVQIEAKRSNRPYVAVRFGNVLGSRGSVVPLFQEQIARGGPVTVTHPEVKRYFMTIPEAVQLVLQAAALGQGGEVFVLDMGEPVKIVDLARDLIRLSGLEPDRDIEIVFSGLRPGDKLFEELFAEGEVARTMHEKILVAMNEKIDHIPNLEAQVEGLVREAQDGDVDAVMQYLTALVPSYRPASVRSHPVQPADMSAEL